jgi:hypothetical protein
LIFYQNEIRCLSKEILKTEFYSYTVLAFADIERNCLNFYILAISKIIFPLMESEAIEENFEKIIDIGYKNISELKILIVSNRSREITWEILVNPDEEMQLATFLSLIGNDYTCISKIFPEIKNIYKMNISWIDFLAHAKKSYLTREFDSTDGKMHVLILSEDHEDYVYVVLDKGLVERFDYISRIHNTHFSDSTLLRKMIKSILWFIWKTFK